MSAADVVVLVAAVVGALAAVVAVAVTAVLATQVRRLERALATLEAQTVPMVEGAQQALTQASAEMERVGAVLEGTEAVTARVDSASRLAQRAFTNPVVKVLALGSGATSGLRRLSRPADGAPGRRAGGG
jgi:inosine-uridine nucleoside N-ribohydrolase